MPDEVGVGLELSRKPYILPDLWWDRDPPELNVQSLEVGGVVGLHGSASAEEKAGLSHGHAILYMNQLNMHTPPRRPTVCIRVTEN